MRKTMKDIYEKRLLRVREGMKKRDLAQLLVSDPPALAWLTGEDFDPRERLAVLVIDIEGGVRWVRNGLFPVNWEEDIPVLAFRDGEDGMETLAEDLAPEGTIGVDKNWPSHFLLELMARAPRAYVNGSPAVDEARAVKDEEEIRLMRAASRVNDRCMARLVSWLREGVTEKEAEAYLRVLYREEGCEDVSFPPIIAFGPDGADPHHTSGERRLERNTVVLLDIGGKKEGYCSDMTRTVFFGDPGEEAEIVHAAVKKACETAEALVRPGVPLADLDRAARAVIEAAGYGDRFTHRLGHFIGRTDHEAGEVSAASPIIACPGMIFSIEPGVYLPGKFGVRIEDLVLVTEDGAEILNRYPKGPEMRVL